MTQARKHGRCHRQADRGAEEIHDFVGGRDVEGRIWRKRSFQEGTEATSIWIVREGVELVVMEKSKETGKVFQN